MKFILSFIFYLLLIVPTTAQKVVCVGASITEGALTSDPSLYSYPSQLQRLLEDTYQVINCGVSSSTMLRKGDHSYWNTDAYKRAMSSNPDIVFIDLGGNDAKLVNRIHMKDMVKDCSDMVKSFRALPSNPRVILLLPFVSFESDTTQIWDPILVNEIIPRIREVAYNEEIEVLDMHSLLVDRADLLPDKIHPNDEGSAIIAKRLFSQIKLKKNSDFDIRSKLKSPYSTSDFYGYKCLDFKLRGRECKIVEPKFSAPNKPWVWRSRFWGHEPQAEIALLERGFHIVYCDASELMGNKETISIWNDFYKLLTSYGLSKKSAMVGMSRGAMYAFSWAVTYPNRVNCVYVDNPLLDCRYLADKEDKSLDEMIFNFMKAYRLRTKKDIRNFKESPIDNVKSIAKGRYPILILCADQDEAVDPQQTYLFEAKIKELGGDITVVTKHGFKHHPHSLPNPNLIVDFIVNSTKNN